MHRFQKLDVYQRSLDFTRTTRQISQIFPKNEQYVLSAQFRRAADSISLNICEGAGNDSPKEFSRFLAYSVRSGYECTGCLDIALHNGFISKEVHAKHSAEIQEMVAMLVALQKSIQK